MPWQDIFFLTVNKEKQIYNWIYSDKQRKKENWQGDENPYVVLSYMVMMTYQILHSIRQIAMQGEFNEFNLNVFFSAKSKGADALVSSQCGFLLCDEKSADAETEYWLLCNGLQWKRQFLRRMICQKNRFWILQNLSGTWIRSKRKGGIHRRLRKNRLCMGGIWKSHAIRRQRQNRQNLYHKRRWICAMLWLDVSFGIKRLVWGR